MHSTSRRIIRCSAGEKSRPSIRVANLPAPPNSASITANTSDGSHTISPLPRSGLTATRLKLAGTTTSRRNAPYFWTRVLPIETSGLLRIRSNTPVRRLRAKRSLTASSAGMRRCTTRSRFARSNERTAARSSAASASGVDVAVARPCSSASTSSCDRICCVMLGTRSARRSLDDEARELHRADRVDRRRGLLALALLRGRFVARVLRRVVDRDAQRAQRLAPDLPRELVLALGGQQLGRALLRQHRSEVVADRGHVLAQPIAEVRILDHQLVQSRVRVRQPDGKQAQE